jgi:O-antigen/teichoic acid export membrane protein
MKDKTAKAALWMLVDVGGSQGLSFLIYAVLTRVLKPAEYGVFVLALAITAIANIVLFQGFGDALIQRESVSQDDLDTAFWTNLGMGVAIASALYLASDWFEAVFKAPGLGAVTASLAVLCILRALVSVHSALCRRDLKMSLFAARAISAYVLGGTAGIILALHAWGVWALVVCQIVQAAVILVIMWLTIDWRPRLRFSTTSFRELSHFSRSFILASVLTSITDKIDNLVIGLFLDVTAVGYYGLALKVLQTVGLLTTMPLQQIMMPVLARLSRNQHEFADEYTRLVTASMATWLPAVAGIGVLAPTLLPVAFGDHWAGAVPVLQAMSFAGLSVPLWSFTGQALSALGRPHLFVRLAFLQLVLAAICFTAASRFGIVAVGAAWAGVSALIVPFHLRVLHQATGIPVMALLTNAGRIAICGASMAGVMILVRDLTGDAAWAIFLEGAIGGSVYLMLLEFVMLPGYVSSMVRMARAAVLPAGSAR